MYLSQCEIRMLPAATKSKYGKISKSYILTLSNPQEHVMSVKCEEPLDELIIYLQSKFGYLYIKPP